MGFLIVILIVAVAGGALGYFAGKKWRSAKYRQIEVALLCAALCLAVYAALEVSKVYFVCVIVIAGELIGMAARKKKE